MRMGCIGTTHVFMHANNYNVCWIVGIHFQLLYTSIIIDLSIVIELPVHHGGKHYAYMHPHACMRETWIGELAFT